MDWSRESASKHLEKLFLAAAEKGDKKAMIVALENKGHFNTDCVDSDGRSALVIAVHNRNLDIIKLLLEHETGLGDALLRAVDIQYTAAVQIICENIKKRNLLPDALYCRALNGDLHPDITPVILAAHHNSYDVLRVLLEFGARIEDPETYTFTTEEFTLQQSVGMINVYKALASQAFMALTSDDPIDKAFSLSHKLLTLSERNYEFRSQYEELAKQCEVFAADLLSHVRDSTEQAIVLNHDPDSWAITGKFNEPYKVQRAIKCYQKQFVAHAHCQQRLIERWFYGLPHWRKQGEFTCFFLSILMGISYPILSICYMLAPGCKLSRLLRIPYVKFICSTASSMTFLLLLGMQAFDIDVTSYNYTLDENGTYPQFNMDVFQKTRPPSFSETLIVFWVIGYTWAEITDVWKKGPRSLKENFAWKTFDFLTISLYWAWIAIRLTILLQAFFALRSLKPVVAVDGADIPNNDVDNDVSFYPTIDSSGYDGIVDIDAMHDDEEEILPAYQPAWIREYDPTGDLDLENLVLIFKDAAECQDSFQQNLTVFLQGKLILVQSVMEELTRYRNEAAKAETHTRNRRAARRINKGGASSGSAGGADEEEEALSNYPRYQLAATDPILVAESLFALAKVFSFLRVTRITVVHMQVGPMQISLGRMMFDICRFLTIFSFVWFAFSIGLNQLYFVHSYEKKLNCHLSGTTDALCPVPYGSVVDSLTTLFWALFGMAELSTLDIRGADHWFTENIGRLLFAAYNVVAIVVLLNVLIAMMSNTYTRIEEDADMQWKFSRSSLWMSFYDESNTLSPPFNYIPTWRSFRFIMKNLKGKFNGEKQERKRKKQSIFAKKEQEYKDVIHQLVQRYIFDKRRSGEDEEGGDPLLMQLKEDISGFKYDMFEALTDMDSKMRQLKSQIDQKQAEPVRQDPPHMIGSEMLQAMHDAVAPKPKSPQPIGPETFQHWGSIHLIDETSDILEEEEEGNEEYVDSEQESLVHSMHSIKIE